MSEAPPNVILILADQMRGDCLGVAGHPVLETPHLDELAARGAYFPKAYSEVPSCLPARAILWTGMNQWHTGILGMGRGQGPIPNDFPHTLAGEFQKAGYQTHLVGKGHFTPQRASMGFESRELDESGRLFRDNQKDDYREWFDREKRRDITPDDHGVDWNSWMARPWHTEEYLHPTAWTMTRAIHFLAQRDFSRPFFLNISFARPHSPYVPPQPYFDYYDRMELPEPHIGDWAEMFDRPVTSVNAWCGRLSPRRIHRARAGYYGEINFIDTQIGRLMNWLRRHQPEVYRNTWFLFTSDHGDMMGDHHLWRKTYAYEGSARIPLLIAPPAGESWPRGQVIDAVVGLQDVMPTLLEAAGLEIPPTVDGRSLLPFLRGEQPNARWRRYIHGEHCTCYAPEQEMQYVTNGHRKLIWLPRIDRYQFFDLDADPGELRDLAESPAHRAMVERWKGYLIAELEARNCGWVQNGRLTCPEGPLISPYRDRRYTGEERER